MRGSIAWKSVGILCVMKLLGNTHLVAGGPEMVAEVLLLLQERGIATRGNPDIYVREYQRFGIDEARELRDRASSRALRRVRRTHRRQAEDGRRIFVIATPSITNEAQNALLKTLEEPPADAMFFFILPAPETLLPTLRSRAQTLVLSHAKTVEGLVDAKKFLAATATARLEMLKPLLEKDEDDPEADAPRRNGAGKRDLGAILKFLASLERRLEKSPEAMPAGRQGLHAARREGIESVYRARKYIGDKGALVKSLLEQVALLSPRV